MNNKQLKKIWNQVPPDYYEVGIKRNFFQWLWFYWKAQNLINFIKNKDFHTILDIGCAAGTLTNKVSQILPNSKITGVDVYSSALAFGKKRYPHINFVLSDAHKLPFKKNSFDLIICIETIEHVSDPEKVFMEVKRVLGQNGTFILIMDSGSWLFRIVWEIWEKSRGKVWQGAHLHPFHHNELEKLIKKSGFKIIRKKFSNLGMEVSFVLKK